MIGHTLQRETLERLAETDKLSHSYLFFGMPDVGKRTVARSFAYWLERGVWPEGEDENRSAPLQDVLAVSPEDGSIGIDTARSIKTFLWKKPLVSKYRTVVIDDAETLTTQAQNALLKLAEEPPASALLIFITRDAEALWPTLASRLQKIYFSPVEEGAIAKWLQNEHGVAKNKAQRFAKYSFGRPGLAWAYINDADIKEKKKKLEAFLFAKGKALNSTIKDMVAEDDFALGSFLDDLLLRFANRELKNPNAWHAVFKLREEAERYNLNPKIQLTALHQKLSVRK